MKFRKYDKDKLAHAISLSFSLRETLKKLNISPAGGNYQTLKKAINFFNIDTSHFMGQGHLKGKSHNYKTRPINEVLVCKKYENTFRLKNRLIKDGLKEKKCENCSSTEWMGFSIPLELHHKDGNRKNNKLENLEILCPNCHALTNNYRGKNKQT